jgi:D-xylose 1-dehydrogenase (NADP+, D-xylono-1,5-lactone-forming)
MAERKLRWGVVGTANIGRAAVIPALQRSNNGELLAVASREEERARVFAEKQNIPRAYGRYEALLAAEDIEAVYIPLPNSLHREWTIKAAAAGKHILCEKPLALNAAECADMDAAAQHHGVRLMEAFMYRFHPQTEKVLELVQAGAIGEPKLIDAVFTFRLTNPANIRLRPELGGGSLMDVGCYCVNISRTLAHAEPVEVQAYANWGKSGVDEEMAGTLRFANGLLAQFSCGLTLERRELYQVAGTEGHIDVPSAFLPGIKDTTIYEHHGRQSSKAHTVPGVDEYQLMVEHFADCVLHDKPFRYPPGEAAANMGVIEALYRSARSDGQPEAV